VPQIIFSNIKCTAESFTIDCFATAAAAQEPNASSQPEFLGRITRLGMGQVGGGKDATSRSFSQCRKSSVTRTILLQEKNEAIVNSVRRTGIVQVVRSMNNNRVVPESEWKDWPGFTGKFALGIQFV
jgi:tyrosinase